MRFVRRLARRCRPGSRRCYGAAHWTQSSAGVVDVRTRCTIGRHTCEISFERRSRPRVTIGTVHPNRHNRHAKLLIFFSYS